MSILCNEGVCQTMAGSVSFVRVKPQQSSGEIQRNIVCLWYRVGQGLVSSVVDVVYMYV